MGDEVHFIASWEMARCGEMAETSSAISPHLAISGVDFLQTPMGSGLVPVGAGVVKGWVGTLADVVSPGDRAPSWPSHTGEGRPQGMSSPPETEPHPTSQPLPPLQGRRAFSQKTYP